MATLAVRALPMLRSAARRAWPTRPWPIVALALVSLWLPFANYGFRFDLIGGDATATWAFPAELLHELLGVFVDYQGLGQNAAEGIQAIFPTLAIASALHWLGLSTAVVARLMIALYYFVAMTGALVLGERLLVREEAWIRRAGALSGALLFGVNHYTLHVFGTAETYFPLGYIAMPWLLYGVLAGAEHDRRIGIATIAAAVVCAGGAAMNPAFFGLALLVVPLGALLAVTSGASLRRVAAVCIAGVLLGLGLCAWWVLPAPTGFGASLGQLAAEGSNAWVHWMSQRSGFAQLFRLDGYVGGGDLPFAAWYASLPGALLGYGPLIVAVAGIGVVRRRLGAVALMTFAMLVFLAKGVHAPAGAVYQALMDHVPGFSIFRSPYDKWAQLESIALVVIYVLGFAGVVRRVEHWLPRNRAALVAAFVAAIVPIVAYPWPAYAGHMLQTRSDAIVRFVTSLPADYQRVADFLRANVGGSRALVLNVGSQPYPLYSWGYFGQDPLAALAGVPVAGGDVIPRSAVLPAAGLQRALDALNVRYVVVHDDLRNPAPAADADTLVASGDAHLVLGTPSLRVYERRAQPNSLVSLVHDPALIEGVSVANDEAALDPQQTAQLVPNAASGLATAVTLLASGSAQRGDASLGWARALQPAQHVQGAGHLGVVAANPLAAVLTTGHCGRRTALHVRSLSSWSIGTSALPSFDAAFCLMRALPELVYIDGTLVDYHSKTIALWHRPVHTMSVSEASPLGATAALPVSGEDLVFRFVAKGTGNAFDVVPPPVRPGQVLVAEIRTSDDAVVGDGFDGDGAERVRVPVVGRAPLAGEWCFLDFRQSDRRLWPSIRQWRSVRVRFEQTASQHFAFRLGQNVVAAQTLTARDLRGPFKEHAAAKTIPEPIIAWRASGQPAFAWRSSGSALDVQARGSGVAVNGVARLLVTDSYRIHGTYRATGDATLSLDVDGYSVPRAIPMVTDGRVHDFTASVHPPTNSQGHFELIAAATRGDLHLRGAAIEKNGPNALFYAVHPSLVGGRLVHTRRLAPWHFEATVAECTPCLVQVAVSEPSHWLVRGAHVLGTYQGSGQSTGMPWSGNTTGAATWLVDAGRAPRTIDFIFYPAIFALAGAIVSAISLVLGFVLLRRLRPGRRSAGETASLRFSPTSGALRLAAIALVLALVPSADLASYADIVGALLWLCLLLLALALLFERSPRRSVIDVARVGDPVPER